jgi:flavin reductase (DIM6/NTAB) family NADH-FMN oxidoreductase RutF
MQPRGELPPEMFKDIFARLASSVAVVTFRAGQHLHGFTATSLTAVSMTPPLALFCVAQKNHSYRHLEIGTAIGISLLSEQQSDLSTRFAGKVPPGGYADVPIVEATPGIPRLRDALAFGEGKISELIPAGDHTIYLCRLDEGALGADGRPLLYFSRGYCSLNQSP